MAAKTVKITSGASLSAAIQVWDTSETHPQGVVALIMPATWTAATLSFQASADGVNFFNLVNTSGVEVQPVVAPLANQFIPLDPSDFISCSYLKIRSGLSSAAVTQGQDSIITVVTRRI